MRNQEQNTIIRGIPVGPLELGIPVQALFWVAIILLLTSCAHFDHSPAGWNEFERFALTAGPMQLHYEEYGSGEPIVFLHGFGASTYAWRYVVQPLAATTRVILLDLKGFGQSPKPRDEKYSVYDQAHLVRQFIYEHDLRNVTLVGHSFGGGVALVTALYLSEIAPERLKRLILIDSISYPQPMPSFIRILATPVVGALVTSFVPVKIQVRHVLALAYYDARQISEEAVTTYAEPLRMAGARYAIRETARQIIPSDLPELAQKYRQISMPTLILWGREDTIVPLTHGEHLHHTILNSRLIILDHCGHVPHEETPEAALHAMQAFISGDQNMSLP
jgi:pimeloyl-ACP methyl ester carboxylesterase